MMVIMTHQVHYYSKILMVICLFFSMQAGGYGYTTYGSQEYYHTPYTYGCLVDGRPSPFKLASRIAKGRIKSHAYDIILESHGFRMQEIDSTLLAYALYVISERIGDERAKGEMGWLERYMDRKTIDRLRSVIYQKYSRSYLEHCFSIDGAIPLLSVNDIYPLYMD